MLLLSGLLMLRKNPLQPQCFLHLRCLCMASNKNSFEPVCYQQNNGLANFQFSFTREIKLDDAMFFNLPLVLILCAGQKTILEIVLVVSIVSVAAKCNITGSILLNACKNFELFSRLTTSLNMLNKIIIDGSINDLEIWNYCRGLDR